MAEDSWTTLRRVGGRVGGRTSFSESRFSEVSCPPKSSPFAPPIAGETESPLLATRPVTCNSSREKTESDQIHAVPRLEFMPKIEASPKKTDFSGLGRDVVLAALSGDAASRTGASGRSSVETMCSFGIWQRRLPHNCTFLVIFKHM